MDPARQETATLAGGCFWCLEAVFEQLRGVRQVRSGYAGGHVPHPTYEQVCSGQTGHAEAVQIHFDPTVVSFDELLQVFFSIHDPSTLNRQGADVGTQYRSAIFHHSEAQRQAAEGCIAALTRAGLFQEPIVTQVVPYEHFEEAEAEHQEFYRRNPGQPYCMAVVAPKVAKFRKQFLDMLRG
jgi:peptide-methionine (S)-S-oxide reductase